MGKIEKAFLELLKHFPVPEEMKNLREDMISSFILDILAGVVDFEWETYVGCYREDEYEGHEEFEELPDYLKRWRDKMRSGGNGA